MTNKQVIIVSIVVIFLAGLWYFNRPEGGGSFQGLTASKCNVSSVVSVKVGASNSVQVLASTTRAWARIWQPTATSSIYVSFDEDAPAVILAGMELNASTTRGFIDFGRNTEFPYVGSVQAITSGGSTTIRVTECIY